MVAVTDHVCDGGSQSRLRWRQLITFAAAAADHICSSGQSRLRRQQWQPITFAAAAAAADHVCGGSGGGRLRLRRQRQRPITFAAAAAAAVADHVRGGS